MSTLAQIETDEELFAKVREHSDTKAFNELYKRYSKRLYSYCLRVFQDRDTAQDAYQQVFVSVFEHKESFKGGNFAAWIMTITRNRCLMIKRGIRQHTDVEDVAYKLADNTRTSDFSETEVLQMAIQKLPEEYREVIELRYFDELSYDEIAELTNTGLSLVKVRLHRAKKMLADSLSSLRRD